VAEQFGVCEVMFSQGCEDSLLERVVFFSIDILSTFTPWMFRQYFFVGHFF
jgi:hypothetical protein